MNKETIISVSETESIKAIKSAEICIEVFIDAKFNSCTKKIMFFLIGVLLAILTAIILFIIIYLTDSQL